MNDHTRSQSAFRGARADSPPHRPPRTGFVLPFVLVTLLLVAALAGATSFASWRAVRSARLGFNGERALQGADEALVTLLASWDATSYAARPVGSRWTRTVITSDLGSADVTLARAIPLGVVLRASMRSQVGGSPDTAARYVTRYVPLTAPAYPLRASFTALGAVTVQGAAFVDGLDARSASDGCGTGRDTGSVPGVHALSTTIPASAAVTGRPPVVPGTLAAATAAADRIAFDSAWNASVTRIARTDAVAATAALPAATLWSARRAVSADSLASTPPVIELGGASTHSGLLLVDGDLVVTGSLAIEGLLIVRGRIDASAGSLVVDGAAFARDYYAGGSTLGDASRIRYSQCTARRALATVARPGNAPFAVWIER